MTPDSLKAVAARDQALRVNSLLAIYDRACLSGVDEAMDEAGRAFKFAAANFIREHGRFIADAIAAQMESGEWLHDEYDERGTRTKRVFATPPAEPAQAVSVTEQKVVYQCRCPRGLGGIRHEDGCTAALTGEGK